MYVIQHFLPHVIARQSITWIVGRFLLTAAFAPLWKIAGTAIIIDRSTANRADSLVRVFVLFILFTLFNLDYIVLQLFTVIK